MTNPNLLMRLLPISTLLYNRHDQVLRRHKRQLLPDPPLNHLLVHHQSLAHVLQCAQHNIGREERFGERDAAVGGVIEGTLEPLDRGGHECVLMEGEEVTGEGADAFGAHGVAFVGHSGGADLSGFKGLLDFLWG